MQNAFVDGGLDFMQPMTQIGTLQMLIPSRMRSRLLRSVANHVGPLVCLLTVECWVDQNPGLGGRIPTFMGTLQTLRKSKRTCL